MPLHGLASCINAVPTYYVQIVRGNRYEILVA